MHCVNVQEKNTKLCALNCCSLQLCNTATLFNLSVGNFIAVTLTLLKDHLQSTPVKSSQQARWPWIWQYAVFQCVPGNENQVMWMRGLEIFGLGNVSPERHIFWCKNSKHSKQNSYYDISGSVENRRIVLLFLVVIQLAISWRLKATWLCTDLDSPREKFDPKGVLCLVWYHAEGTLSTGLNSPERNMIQKVTKKRIFLSCLISCSAFESKGNLVNCRKNTQHKYW